MDSPNITPDRAPMLGFTKDGEFCASYPDGTRDVILGISWFEADAGRDTVIDTLDQMADSCERAIFEAINSRLAYRRVLNAIKAGASWPTASDMESAERAYLRFPVSISEKVSTASAAAIDAYLKALSPNDLATLAWNECKAAEFMAQYELYADVVIRDTKGQTITDEDKAIVEAWTKARDEAIFLASFSTAAGKVGDAAAADLMAKMTIEEMRTLSHPSEGLALIGDPAEQ